MTARLSPWTSAFLWRVEGSTTTYLLGTMHAPDPRVERRPAALEQALAASAAVVTELKFGFFDILNMTSRMILQPPATLDGTLPPALVARIDRQLAQHGMAWGQVRIFKIWLLGTILDAFLYDPNGTVLDMSLQTYAERHRKASEALETVDEQVGVFDGMSSTEQVALLEKTLEGIETGRARRDLDTLREAFFSGDEVQAQQLLDADDASESPVAKKLSQRLLGERNVRMAARIVAQRAEGKTRLYAVGVAHLLGKDGVVERLRRAGLTVTRLGAPIQSTD